MALRRAAVGLCMPCTSRPTPTTPQLGLLHTMTLTWHMSEWQNPMSSLWLKYIYSWRIIVLSRSVRFSSVQFSSRWYICARECSYSLYTVSQQFETVPMLVWLTMAHGPFSPSQGKSFNAFLFSSSYASLPPLGDRWCDVLGFVPDPWTMTIVPCLFCFHFCELAVGFALSGFCPVFRLSVFLILWLVLTKAVHHFWNIGTLGKYTKCGLIWYWKQARILKKTIFIRSVLVWESSGE